MSGHAPRGRGLADDLEALKHVDIAIGLLIGLRGYSQIDAEHEFCAAVQETSVSAKRLAQALVALASAEIFEPAPPHSSEVQVRWGHLLMVRGFSDDHATASIPDVPVRHGPDNG